jgi:serine/threonine-protein kinase
MAVKSKRITPYILITLAFFAGIIVLVLLVDKIIMPFMILNKETTKVPKVLSLPLSKARDILDKSDLTFHIAAEQFSQEYPAGTVLRQSPEPYSEVKSGRRIYLTLSKGKESVSVPYIVGKTIRGASVLLAQRGLVLGDTLYEYSDVFQRDTVVRQSKPHGYNAYYGDTIDIIVSMGSQNQVEVPQLIGRSLDEAEAILQQAGLVVGSINYIENDGTFLTNTIINQSPKHQDMVPQFSEIHLIVVGK